MNVPANAIGLPPNDRSILRLLEGLTLPNGWVVGQRIDKPADQTGGHFSEGYECISPTGQPAFLKAVDLFEALNEDDVISALSSLSDGVMCERELLQLCRRMDRVVTFLEFGYIRELNGHRLTIQIPYFIFERAEGTIRNLVRASARPSDEWSLRTLHHISTGVMQLHRVGIAHQDVKLSNALCFDKGNSVKLGDLGRSIQKGRAVWYDRAPWPGDNAYAPPEVAYGFQQSEFNTRRLSADLFLLGSFACSLFARIPLNTLLYDRLHPDFRPPMFGGTYAGSFENVVAHLHEAFDLAMHKISEFISPDAPYKDELLTIIRQLSAPDPRDRGHPRTRALNANVGNIYDLERYVSMLPNLVLKAAGFARARQDT